MLLFKIFDCRFCIYLLAISTCVFVTLAIIGTTLVCGRFGSRVFLISKILICFFLFQIIQRCDTLYLDCYWISCELAKISMVEKLISKERQPLWVIRQFFTDGSPTPYGYTAGVRPIKVASYGCFSIQNKSKSTSHRSPVTSHSLSASPVTSHRASRHG